MPAPFALSAARTVSLLEATPPTPSLPKPDPPPTQKVRIERFQQSEVHGIDDGVLSRRNRTAGEKKVKGSSRRSTRRPDHRAVWRISSQPQMRIVPLTRHGTQPTFVTGKRRLEVAVKGAADEVRLWDKKSVADKRCCVSREASIRFKNRP